jgi:hypothetical protein
MKLRTFAALAGIATASQLIHGTPALAESIAKDRQSTGIVVQLLASAKSARLALMRNDTAAATKEIDSAAAARTKLVRVAHANGASVIVPIYTELDTNAALSDDFMIPERVPYRTRAGHIRSLETTYFAINLDKAKTRLDAAQHAVRDGDSRSAETSLAGIRSDLIHGNDAADVPLLAARRELALAQGDISSNQLGAASANLQKASNSLKGYSSVGHGAAVHQLADDIESSMRVNTQSGSAVSTKIDGWWTSVKTWFSLHA